MPARRQRRAQEDTCILATSFIVTVPNGITFSCGVLPSSVVTGSPDIKISGTGSLVVANGGTLQPAGLCAVPRDRDELTTSLSLIVRDGRHMVDRRGQRKHPILHI